MILRAILGLSLIALVGCTTTSDPNSCNGYERGRLNGLKIGAGMVTPDPSTAKGKAVLDEMAQLEAKCGN